MSDQTIDDTGGIQMTPHIGSSRRMRVLLIAILSLLPFVLARPCAAQADRLAPLDVNVDDPRPLAAAIEALERRHGWIITYEDPPYVFAGDILDVTAQVRKDGAMHHRVLVPAGGPFRFTYAASAAASKDASASLLEGLLEQYRASGNAGAFRLVQTGTVFHIIPTGHRNALGASEITASLLDATISINTKDQTALQTLQALVAALNRATGEHVILGMAPLNLLMRTGIKGMKTEGRARTILLQMLEATGQSLSWQLFCLPGAARFCALNLHPVKATASQ
jgi:hypothetical protein